MPQAPGIQYLPREFSTCPGNWVPVPGIGDLSRELGTCPENSGTKRLTNKRMIKFETASEAT